MTARERSKLIKNRALELGFQTVGITDLTPPPHADALERWLAAGMAGSMTYMGRQARERCDPSRIVRGATHSVILTRGYFTDTPPEPQRCGRVAQYARGRDYHVALQEPLEALADFIRSLGDAETIAVTYVDAGPVPERELAQRAGLGWIGKNTMLIDPVRGSFFFIASVFTNLHLEVDAPFEADRCGTCRRCLEACPTNAFPEPRVLDSRLCISYLTIEHRGPLDEQSAGLVQDWVFGCDICQDVCPWNTKFAKPSQDETLDMTNQLAFLDLAELSALDEESFEAQYGWTPMERAGSEGLRRNADLVLRNGD